MDTFTTIAKMHGLHQSDDFAAQWGHCATVYDIRDELKYNLLRQDDELTDYFVSDMFRAAVHLIDFSELAMYIWQGLMGRASSFELRSRIGDEVIRFDGMSPYDIINDRVRFVGDQSGTDMIRIDALKLETWDIVITGYNAKV